jgi:hypothetical protein
MSAQLALGLMQAAGSLIQGIGAYQTAKLEKFNVDTESQLANAQGIQTRTATIEAFKTAISSADALYSKFGRDVSDPSAMAQKEADKETVGSDISDVAIMARINQLAMKQQGAATMRRGRESLYASMMEAATTGSGAYFDWKKTQ